MIMLIALFSKFFELCMVDDDGDDLRWPEEEIQGVIHMYHQTAGRFLVGLKW